jgi:hypothetical protein
VLAEAAGVNNLPQIDLGKITTLGTLLLATLLILAGLAGVTAAAGGPTWLLIGVFIMLVIDFVVVLGAVALSVTRRHPHYLLSTSDVLIRLYQRGIDDFHRDTKQLPSGKPGRPEPGSLEYQRKEMYETNQGLFLVHTWRPSSEKGQVADIVIRLAEHRDTPDRPSVLKEGKIESVTYELGRKFSADPFVKTDATDNFGLEISAWGSMLCLAVVAFNDGTEPIQLTRYIDFPTEDEMLAALLL